ncbi:MAG: hypothetical protein LBT69_04270 [Lactobacillales bacterium]|nr:hypothetical protein [Lactobacillales bacterium]
MELGTKFTRCRVFKNYKPGLSNRKIHIYAYMEWLFLDCIQYIPTVGGPILALGYLSGVSVLRLDH